MSRFPGKAAAYVLDVGHGNSSVVCSDGMVVVIDAGPGSSLLSFLQEIGVDSVHTVFLSHADQDHIGGLLGLLASGVVKVERIRLNTDSVKDTKGWKDVLVELSDKNRHGTVDVRLGVHTNGGEDLSLGDTEIVIESPSIKLAGIGAGGTLPNGRKVSTNSVSTVLGVRHLGKPVLMLAGDIDSVGLDDIRGEGRDIRSAVLVYPHHGGSSGGGDSTEFTASLIQAVEPQSVVFSIGRSRFNNPDPVTVDELRRLIPDVRVCCTQLSTHCSGELPNADPPHLRQFARGRAQRVCCAGTITVDLPNATIAEPEVKGHQEFVTLHASSALCRR